MAKQVRSAEEALLVNAITPQLFEHPTNIEIDDDTCAVLNFTEFKSDNELGWADVLFNQKNMPVAMRFDPIGVLEIKESIDSHDKQVADMLFDARSASKSNDLARERKHGIQILDMMGDEGERFFNGSIQTLIRSTDKEKLTTDIAYFRSMVAPAGMNFKVIAHNQLKGFLAGSPLRTNDEDGTSQTVRPFPASTIGHSLYTQQNGLMCPVGIDLGQDNQNGGVRINPTHVDATHPNENMVIVGTSGSGKTTLAKALITKEYLVFGSRVIAIDPEGEFLPLINALGGEAITIGSTSTTKISPLQPRALCISHNENDDNDDSEGNALDEYVLTGTFEFAKSFLQIAFNIEEHELNYLEIALEKAYAKYGITRTTTFAEYYDKNMSYPVMEDLYNVLVELTKEDQTHSDIYDRIAVSIRSAAIGVQSHMWNGRSNFKITNDLVCFNTEGLDGTRLLEAWYYNILSWVWSEIRMAPNKEQHIRVVIDEAHIPINPRYPVIADMVKSMVKRIRKRNGGTTIITQEVNDLLNERIVAQGQAILDNACYKFIGLSDGHDLKAIQELYQLQDEIVEKIRKADKGNFALFAGTRDRTWLKVEIEPWLFDLFAGKRIV